MSTREKVKVVKSIMFHYHLRKGENTQYCRIIDKTLSLMPVELGEFFMRDFDTPLDKHWWVGLYSPASYHSYRAKAVDFFINCLRLQRML